jgi:hypothetical protein
MCDTPSHKVTFTYNFYMGKFELTQKQWEAVMDTNPSEFKKAGPNAPVECVSWNDCKEFCNKLNSLKLVDSKGKVKVGKFRLSSESEWEYACRAGTTTRFYWGDGTCTPDSNRVCDLNDYAWWSNNNNGSTEPVGGKKPNAWGLYDMVGNVYEWCEDPWHIGYTGHPANGSVWQGTELHKLTRGSWRGYPQPQKFTSFFRTPHRDTLRHGCCGVRIACDTGLATTGNLNRWRTRTMENIESSFSFGRLGERSVIFYLNLREPVHIYDLKGVRIAEIAATGRSAPYTAVWEAARAADNPASCYIAFQRFRSSSVLFSIVK